jgi:hypothetical protein
MYPYNLSRFVNREKELDYVLKRVIRLAKGDPFAPNERIVHFVGPSGIGKSWLLEKCCELVGAVEKCVPVLLKFDLLKNMQGDFIGNYLVAVDKEFSDKLGIKIQEINKKSQSKYGSDLTRKINQQAKDNVILLLLDEINLVQQKELHDVEEQLLEKLFDCCERIVLITAGRSYPMFNTFTLRPNSENTFPLSAFDENTTGEQLEKLRPGSKPLAIKVLELGGGVPGHNTKLAGQAAGYPPQITNELQAVQSLLMDIKNSIANYFHPIIEAICILQDFDPDDTIPLLGCHPALVGEWDATKLRDVFTDLKKIQVGPGGLINWDKEKKSFVIDEPTRLLFERELRMRNPELWRQLHCTAYQMYKKWGEEYDSQRFKKKSEYHRQTLRSAGMDCNDLKLRFEA